MGSGLSYNVEAKLASERVLDPATLTRGNVKTVWRRGSLRRCSVLEGVDIHAEQETDTVALAKGVSWGYTPHPDWPTKCRTGLVRVFR